MKPTDQLLKYDELPPKARRAVRIIYIVMAVMILLPILLVWVTGSIGLSGS